MALSDGHKESTLLISIVANGFSATVGLCLLTFGMLGRHMVVDHYMRGTFASFNKIATIGIMLIGSVLIEMVVVRIIWKFPLRKTLPVLVLGNILSYGVIVADLYVFGGWLRSF